MRDAKSHAIDADYEAIGDLSICSFRSLEKFEKFVSIVVNVNFNYGVIFARASDNAASLAAAWRVIFLNKQAEARTGAFSARVSRRAATKR